MTSDYTSAAPDRISVALDEIERTSPHQTDGKWLEHLTADCAPLIAEWEVSGAWLWQDWPDRQTHYQKTPDIGIDVVARRASDGRFIAIQSKSRELDEHGRGSEITKKEFDSFPLNWPMDNGSNAGWFSTARSVSAAPVATGHPARPLRRANFVKIAVAPGWIERDVHT